MLFTANQFGQLLTENILDPNGEIIASARYDDTDIEAFYFYNCDPHGNTWKLATDTNNQYSQNKSDFIYEKEFSVDNLELVI